VQNSALTRSNGRQIREAVFDPDFRDDLRWWVRTDRKVALRLLDLVEAVLRDPFDGIGKPEPVKSFGSDVWSRRLTHEHRLLYRVSHDQIDFIQARYHY
jgi:toxin YoeB